MLPLIPIAAGIWVAKAIYDNVTRSKNVAHGYERELAIARYLRGTGADVHVSPGSRGPADLTATWSSGRVWKIQVKASRQGIPKQPSPEERRRLKQVATRAGAVAVVAISQGTRTAYYSARTGDRLYP